MHTGDRPLAERHLKIFVACLSGRAQIREDRVDEVGRLEIHVLVAVSVVLLRATYPQLRIVLRLAVEYRRVFFLLLLSVSNGLVLQYLLLEHCLHDISCANCCCCCCAIARNSNIWRSVAASEACGWPWFWPCRCGPPAVSAFCWASGGEFDESAGTVPGASSSLIRRVIRGRSCRYASVVN